MPYPRVFAIGASAGGIEALLAIVQDLPSGLPAPILIVVHISPDSPGYLPEILARNGPLPATNAVDGSLMQGGHIYVARPDRHLIVNKGGKIATPRGPRENRSRPAIDPLFRSVALSFGARAVGIVLSGGLDDGAAGLRSIKMCGGTAIVQDPADSIVDSMPMSAMRNATIDYCLPASEIAFRISELAHEEPERKLMAVEKQERKQIEREVAIAGKSSEGFAIREFGTPSIFTCPECHGALMRIRGDNPVRFRCHTGHAYTAETLLSELRETTEQAIWGAVRSLHEEAMLFDHIAEHWEEVDPVTAGYYRDQAKAMLARAEQIQRTTDEGYAQPVIQAVASNTQ
ncbi:MAG: chemotaxis protein CheB [Proteobacteria bacterium]|nr:chemotaxis protein CheB [Pseudomonadota bacterium]